MFFGSADYIGQDKIELLIVPNLDCTLSPVNIRMYDMFALVGRRDLHGCRRASGANSAARHIHRARTTRAPSGTAITTARTW